MILRQKLTSFRPLETSSRKMKKRVSKFMNLFQNEVHNQECKNRKAIKREKRKIKRTQQKKMPVKGIYIHQTNQLLVQS